MKVSDILELLAQGTALNDYQADFMFGQLLGGDLDPAQAGAFLMGLRCKGEDSTDLAAGVRAGVEHAVKLPGITEERFTCIDTAGTGGDNKNSFNCSTATALYLADMGHKVVKHGNRSVSSNCGSADVLEALGVTLSQDPATAKDELDAKNFIFLFAPAFHPAFKHIMPVRLAMGIRTLFNLMGPLLNPARPSHQIIGVGNPAILELMGETLLLTGVEKALLIHGAGGYDELTTFGPARGYLIQDGKMEKTVVDPDKLGFKRYSPEAVEVEGKDHAIAVMKDILTGKGPEAMMMMVALNLGACIHLLEERPLDECCAMARKYVMDGLQNGVVDV